MSNNLLALINPRNSSILSTACDGILRKKLDVIIDFYLGHHT